MKLVRLRSYSKETFELIRQNWKTPDKTSWMMFDWWNDFVVWKEEESDTLAYAHEGKNGGNRRRAPVPSNGLGFH